MKDSVFEGVLVDLPVDSTNVEVSILVSYKDDKGTHKERTTRFFPSKAEATFRRKMTDANDSIKALTKEIRAASGSIKGLEERMHKRLTKLERKNDPDTAVATE